MSERPQAYDVLNAHLHVHGFRAVGDRLARHLNIDASENMHDAFYAGIGTPVPVGQWDLPTPKEPDIAMIMAKAGEVGMTIVIPAQFEEPRIRTGT